MKRREMLLAGGAALLGMSAFPLGKALANTMQSGRKILYFTRCAGFVHSVVDRKKDALSYSEKLMIEGGKKYGCEVVCSKDGRIFDGDLDQYSAIVFYTSGDLTQPIKDRDEPPMSKEGYKKLLDAIAAGKGFFGFHSANDSFHSTGDTVSPYIKMIGGEFIVHGSQQVAPMKVVSPGFPGMQGLGDSFAFQEEWYTAKNFAKDLHVILVQDTTNMKDACYKRPPYPATWARMHGKGRVFYTSLGHREDVWTNPIFEQIVVGGMSWVMGLAEAEIAPNIDKVTPKANELPK
jgi:type 1 glutamine amidotransferase